MNTNYQYKFNHESYEEDFLRIGSSTDVDCLQ